MAPGAIAPPDPRELLRNDPEIGRKLVGYAFKKTHDPTSTREVSQEAIARVLEGRGWHRWDPNRETLLNHLCDVVDSLVANENRRVSMKRETPMDEEDERKPDPAPSPEQQIDATEQLRRKRRLAARVMERVAKDPILPDMLKHEQAGIGTASELAGLLHCSVRDIYRARERLAYHRDEVLEEERKEEELRLTGRA
jgi:hypothetical protein